MEMVTEIVILVLLVPVLLLEIVLLLRKPSGTGVLRERIKESEERLQQGIDGAVQNQNRSFRELGLAINDSNRLIGENISERFSDMIRKDAETRSSSDQRMAQNISRMQEALEGRMDSFKGDVGDNLREINERLVETIRENAESQKKISENLSGNLLMIRTLTEEKLSSIQQDVNNKLDASLNKRLDESFEKVTNQLTQLYRSLGELSRMSDGISNLNRTLSNVKTRGTWGEIQLGNIFEETMTPAQYVHNIKLKKTSDDIVEYAVKIPSGEDGKEVVYLPVDSKFPLDIYGKLVDASESGSREAYDRCVKELENRIKLEARTIQDKYILPPVTTDFAIMFLPTESMYAEVLRINGLAEFCQTKYRVIISGPTTITALLNSLRVGFANVALNKKTAEVRKILEAVKAQYGKLDALIDATKKKLESAVESTDSLKNRTRLIQKSMQHVGEIDRSEADRILLLDGGTGEAGEDTVAEF